MAFHMLEIRLMNHTLIEPNVRTKFQLGSLYTHKYKFKKHKTSYLSLVSAKNQYILHYVQNNNELR